ncbi:MAG: sigma-54 dependent transcriptional regulator [Pseudomonadota bacterium]
MVSKSLPTVLVVDDEPHSVASMRMALEDDFMVLEAGSASEAANLMEEHWVQVVISDQRMPETTGIEFLTDCRERWPETVRMIVTGYTETNDMIEAINAAGIYQFITKPWHPDQLVMAVRNAVRLFELSRDHERMSLEMRYLSSTASTKLEDRRRQLQEGLGFDSVIRGANSPLNATIELARQYASFDVPILVSGEAGTGKTDLARAIHYGSLRSDKSFYQLNCAGLPDDVLAVELFGLRKSAGAAQTRFGLLQKADPGTIFLNGVDALSPSMQIALLRVLTEGAFQPVGSHETQTTHARVLTGAHTDLRAAVRQGIFRTDLYFHLAVTELELPPLRSRSSDIALLADQFLDAAAKEHGKPIRGMTAPALEFLENYEWPGNLPELRNEVLRMLIKAQDVTLGPELISRHILQAVPRIADTEGFADEPCGMEGTLKDRVEIMEMRILRETMTRLKWNKSRAATELGLSRVGLRAKLDRYGIEPHALKVVEE